MNSIEFILEYADVLLHPDYLPLIILDIVIGHFDHPLSYNINIHNMIKIISTLHPQLKLGRYSYSQLTTYTQRGRHRPPIGLAVGDTVGSFKLNCKDYYKDFDITHLEMQHPVGAKLHLLECA
jgi:hypothetical protein